jgi:hypothetical protein
MSDMSQKNGVVGPAPSALRKAASCVTSASSLSSDVIFMSLEDSALGYLPLNNCI